MQVRKAAIALLMITVVVLGVAASKRVLRREAVTKEPTSCRLILASLPADKPVDQEIAHQQSLIQSGSTSALERLGWTFVKKARLSFDAGFYKLAEECAACMQARGAAGPDALLLRAHALQSLHHFAAAESAARELVRLRERPFDYGVLGDVLIDQGKVREGAAAYQKMVDLRPDLQSYARAAHVRWLTGNLEGAIELMKLATSASSPNDPEAGAWAYTRLALYQLQRGTTKDALNSGNAALSLQSDYAPAMLARGRTLLALNRGEEALVEFQRAAKLNPLPEYQWWLEDALRVDSQIVARAGTEDPRTLSLYLATRHYDTEHAVQLAQEELTNRSDVFTHDALAWALAAAGRAADAQPQMGQALSEGTADARLYFHAGVIAALNNDDKEARRWLHEAAAIQQMLLPSERVQLDLWRKRV